MEKKGGVQRKTYKATTAKERERKRCERRCDVKSGDTEEV